MPTVAFLLVLTGIVLVYCEFVWIGKLIFGISGTCLALVGVAILERLPLTAFGLLLILGAALCLIAEYFVQARHVLGFVGGLLLGVGFWKLCGKPPGIAWQTAFPVSFLFGGLTTFLLSIAKQARRNKGWHK